MQIHDRAAPVRVDHAEVEHFINEKRVLVTGAGGFVDITAFARRIVFAGFFTAGADLRVGDGRLTVVKEGRTRKFIKTAEHITFSGRIGRERGQQVVYVTERCVIGLEQDALVVHEIAPGIDLARDVLAQADIPLRVSPNLRVMDAALFRPEPFGLQLKQANNAAGLARPRAPREEAFEESRHG